MLHHLEMAFRRTDRRDDALANPGDDRLLGRPADQLLQIGADGDPGPDLELDAVPGDGRERRLAAGAVGTVDDLRVHARLHRIEHVAAGKVDGTGAVEVEVEVGAMGRDQGADHAGHVSAGEVMGLETAG